MARQKDKSTAASTAASTDASTDASTAASTDASTDASTAAKNVATEKKIYRITNQRRFTLGIPGVGNIDRNSHIDVSLTDNKFESVKRFCRANPMVNIELIK